MSRTVWTWGRVAGPTAILVLLVWRLGTGPFLAGLRTVDGGALAAAAALGTLTTVCCAWRWRTVAGGLGLDLPLSAAVAAYYRSLFLNVTLPGGVVGDVHRGVSHGRDVCDVARALRSVVWERFAGQVVQVLVTLALLLALPSPVQPSMPLVAIAVLLMLAGCAVVARARRGGEHSPRARALRTASADIAAGLIARRAWPKITFASAVVLAGHVVTFLIAARTAGATAPLGRMLPIALLVLAAGVLPSIGGWGPREGVTAWAFGAAGLGAQNGVATAVVYGVMVFAATLPGAVVLLMAWFRGARPSAGTEPPLVEGAAHA